MTAIRPRSRQSSKPRFDRMCDGQDMTAPALARALLVSLSQKPDLVAHLIGHRKG